MDDVVEHIFTHTANLVEEMTLYRKELKTSLNEIKKAKLQFIKVEEGINKLKAENEELNNEINSIDIDFTLNQIDTEKNKRKMQK